MEQRQFHQRRADPGRGFWPFPAHARRLLQSPLYDLGLSRPGHRSSWRWESRYWRRNRRSSPGSGVQAVAIGEVAPGHQQAPVRQEGVAGTEKVGVRRAVGQRGRRRGRRVAIRGIPEKRRARRRRVATEAWGCRSASRGAVPRGWVERPTGETGAECLRQQVDEHVVYILEKLKAAWNSSGVNVPAREESGAAPSPTADDVAERAERKG